MTYIDRLFYSADHLPDYDTGSSSSPSCYQRRPRLFLDFDSEEEEERQEDIWIDENGSYGSSGGEIFEVGGGGELNCVLSCGIESEENGKLEKAVFGDDAEKGKHIEISTPKLPILFRDHVSQSVYVQYMVPYACTQLCISS